MLIGAIAVASIAAAFSSAGVDAHAAGAEANATGFVADAAGNDARIRYDRDIRPILSDRCFKCHGPDSGARRAELRLDLSDTALAPRAHGSAIVPGNPDASELWRRVASSDPEMRMPPDESNKRPLSEQELALVRRWIEEGAQYEPHWSFVSASRPEFPQVRDPAWCRNEIDRFVLARLEREGVAPAPEADDATLARRLFLDLTGLPPTPQEIDDFQADSRSDAYERLVRRLLHEEPYRSRHAERMATPWLDAARYADTNGIHMDAGRQIWPWRDWILRAYRDNMPFDRFLTEQLAGDLLPDATLEQRVASGFNRNHVMTDEGGAIPEEYLVEYAVDRASTTASVFLGLTMGCARCHEHKFDPISQEEFFGFYAYFNSIEEPGLYSQLSDPNRAFEPFIEVPTADQESKVAAITARLDAARAQLEAPSPLEDAELAEFFEFLPARTGVEWAATRATAAVSTGGATLEIRPDGSVLASGANPERDDHIITLRTDATGLRLLSLEALADASLPGGRVGRSENGNGVLSDVEVEAVSVSDPEQRVPVHFRWAWADVEQDNGDFAVVNSIDSSKSSGWAVDGHRRAGGRIALFLSEEPFGFEGGTDLVVRLRYESPYDRHALGRVRLTAGRLGDAGAKLLPASSAGWFVVGPFPADSPAEAHEKAFGPEFDARVDFEKNYGFGNQFWKHDQNLRDGALNRFGQGVAATYVAKRIVAPTARSLEIALGSDDGFRLFLNGSEVSHRRIDRSLEPDQDRVTLALQPGVNTLVLKVVNSGGDSGFFYRAMPPAGELTGILAAGLLAESARSDEVRSRLVQEWKLAFSPSHREKRAALAEDERKLAEVKAGIALTMVMKELPTPRETFVLTRGAYDKPDRARPVTRGVPAVLGKMPDGAPPNRLGLAKWMIGRDNPLVARVAVNRLWELVFDAGLVRTSDDLGFQGEWPSHPELLDWLAVDLHENGWDQQRLITQIVTSSTYRQSSRVRPELTEIDPDNRLLASYPRRRLGGEQIRDLALFTSGLLVERFGGPSVKPYQPEGLWTEVSMPQSNTRIYVRGSGADLWRRSLYSFAKRACPPPTMTNFDAPTREFCTIRRVSTNTPLQALTLWNDEQFVEAARVLAERTLRESDSDDERLAALLRRCTGRSPDAAELELLRDGLASFRERFASRPQDAAGLISVGATAAPTDIAAEELAAWTMVSNAVLNLSATVTQH